MKKTILTILTGAALAVGSANAAVVFGNLGATGSNGIGSSGGTGLTSTTWRAIGFTPAGINLVLNTVTIGLSTTANGTAVFQLDLYSNNAGIPGISLFSTQQSLLANTAAQQFTFTLDKALTAGQSYWIVGQRVGGTGNSSTLSWREPLAGSTVPTAKNGSGWANLGNITGRTSTDDGATWGSTGNGSSSSISLTASPIPEPGTWAAMAIFASGAAYAGWRRRQQQLA
jgi:hypothetical protein